MNIAVVLRQVPDLIETLEIGGDGTCLDYGAFGLRRSPVHRKRMG